MADHYELTKSKDNVQRLTLKVEHRLTLHDIATILIADERDLVPNDWYEYAMEKWKSRREVMSSVRDALEARTLEQAHNSFGGGMFEWRDRLIERLVLLW